MRGLSPFVAHIAVGRVAPLPHGRGTVPSGIVKHPVDSAHVGVLGLDGDEQGDRRVHGGPEKAVFVYPTEHDGWWAEQLGASLPPAAFGENLGTVGLTEDTVFLGDVYEVGGALLQVSQPRRPCFKPAARLGHREIAVLTQTSGRTGFYLRVLRPGTVALGCPVTLLDRDRDPVSVADVSRVMHGDNTRVHQVLASPRLPERWRATLRARLSGAHEDETARLHGPTRGER
ncbi:MOSC domain-containing protein YiiM [Streptoalloteichus tenebrarius]|uniref:MOSC domain-containing protein YiiM n=1 Tax=Streptoalloteichus tenebrarius (strain ATCC 17920 / DSM 40477 / JCM 4838 / CBS 697.72 / NBRC 16177 / NCIMB 11028 / NRRL B-12390 / A12253. 1 / ISP 5477) TaxID=1933 RepID=A0ABT1HYV9_STRSD|nr:MOSC domain-containing protein [Streptoalloteichus tenebrarius]MCP2260717.1 MOSC domain-containing protein YiiM [Streptoalloteichus tenebrarius]BFF03749.1 MOSC domain-containing protein [Streptoalloteichus tenebrarius]